MLELQDFLNICIFPKSIVFLKNFPDTTYLKFVNSLKSKGTLYDFFPVEKSLKKYLSSVLNVLPMKEMFNNTLTIGQNLEFLNKFFGTTKLVMAFVNHFKLPNSFLESSFGDLSKEEIALLPFAAFFFKPSSIWCAFIEDEHLSESSKTLVRSMFSSKVDNSNGIIFYATKSGNSLDFEKEMIIDAPIA